MTAEWVRYQGRLGYLVWPERAATPLPAVVVIAEIWGVDDHIQEIARRLAAAGYAALAPDLYAVDGRRPEALAADRVAEVKAFMDSLPAAAWADPAARQAGLGKLPEPRRARIEETHRGLFAGLGQLDRFVPPLLDSTRWLRETCQVTRGRTVACVGFCMGGALSALLAAGDPDLAGAAVFYGASPPAELVSRIACPVTGFYAGLDPRVNATVPGFAAAMAAAGRSFEQRTYEGARHAFFNDTRPAYDVRAARDAFVRLLAFLQGVSGA